MKINGVVVKCDLWFFFFCVLIMLIPVIEKNMITFYEIALKVWDAFT